jgi:SSS family solute:Na+ symporter
MTYYLALTSVSILKTITTGLAITASFTLLILSRRFFPGLCKRANGFWTILASILIWLAWTFVPETHVVPHVVYLEWPVCLGVFALTSILGKAPVDVMEMDPPAADLSRTVLDEG